MATSKADKKVDSGNKLEGWESVKNSISSRPNVATPIIKSDAGAKYEVVFNGGGSKYWFHADELARLLSTWSDGFVGRAMYCFDNAPYQDTGAPSDLGTGKYIDHGYGYIFLDFEQLSSISIVGMIYH